MLNQYDQYSVSSLHSFIQQTSERHALCISLYKYENDTVNSLTRSGRQEDSQTDTPQFYTSVN